MTNEQFIKYWNNCFPSSYPINYELKYALNDRWLRIHSLPESKRYAENNEEEQIILERQNQVIDDLLTDGSTIIIMIGLYSWNVNDYEFGDQIDKNGYRLIEKIRIDQLDLNYPFKEEAYYNIFIKDEIWRKNRFDDLLLKVANDKIRASIVCFDKCSIAAPYDGGIDLILSSKELRDSFKKRYSDWLSERLDGL